MCLINPCWHVRIYVLAIVFHLLPLDRALYLSLFISCFRFHYSPSSILIYIIICDWIIIENYLKMLVNSILKLMNWLGWLSLGLDLFSIGIAFGITFCSYSISVVSRILSMCSLFMLVSCHGCCFSICGREFSYVW